MKFQNPSIHRSKVNRCTHRQTDRHTHRQTSQKQYALPTFSKLGGIKKGIALHTPVLSISGVQGGIIFMDMFS